MPTISDWINALMVEREVVVNSNDQLINAVKKLQDKRCADLKKHGKTITSKSITKVSDFDPKKTISIAPITLLHALGVTTTPPVPNLVALSSTWAMIRYIWAFAMPSHVTHKSKLKLSDVAQEIDFHQKAVLSDEMGVAMSAVIMGQYLLAPNSVDVSLAINDPAFKLIKTGDASPDYVFFDSAGTKMFVVECKGTQTSRSVAYNQLRRGTEQLPSLQFTSGSSPDSFVIATYLSKSKTEVFVIDPPGDDEKNVNIKESKAIIRDEKDIKARASFFHQAKLLNYIGDEKNVFLKLKNNFNTGNFIRKETNATEDIETDLGHYIGTKEVIHIRDDIGLVIRRGIRSDLRESYINNNNELINEVSSSIQDQILQLNKRKHKQTHIAEVMQHDINDEIDLDELNDLKPKTYYSKQTTLGDITRCQSYGIDGTLLDIQVGKPIKYYE